MGVGEPKILTWRKENQEFSPGGRRASSPDSQTGKPSRSQPSQNRAQQNTKSKQNHIIGAFSQATYLKTHTGEKSTDSENYKR